MQGASNETPTPGRLELKYCVPERVARQVLGVARGYLVRDPLARGPRQRITSLYLDTQDLTFLRWHLDGATDRYKLRIRSYGEAPAATFYAETKRKTASVVRKEREAISAAALDAVVERYRVRLGATPRTLQWRSRRLLTGRRRVRSPGEVLIRYVPGEANTVEAPC